MRRSEAFAAPGVAVLGPRTCLEPGDQQSFDLLVGSVGMLAAKLCAAHRLAQRAQVEGRLQSYRQRVRRVVAGHGGIVRHGDVPGTILAPDSGDRRRS